MSFPCAICQNLFDGVFLWNMHGSSMDEDRHILCTPCLIKFSSKNAKCPLRCQNSFNPVKLNPGYSELITLCNKNFIKMNPNHHSIPDDDVLKNIKLWDKLITNIEDYINLDYYPNIYGTGLIRTLTCFMRNLKSNNLEESIEEIFNINQKTNLTETFSIKIGIKRKYIEEQIEQEIIEQTPRLEIDLREWLDNQLQ